jgi:hypothetical protein
LLLSIATALETYTNAPQRLPGRTINCCAGSQGRGKPIDQKARPETVPQKLPTLFLNSASAAAHGAERIFSKIAWFCLWKETLYFFMKVR